MYNVYNWRYSIYNIIDHWGFAAHLRFVRPAPRMVNDYDFINAHKSGAPSSTTLQARRLVLRHTAASTKTRGDLGRCS